MLQWSDNPEEAIYGTDRLRFLFTNSRTGATTGAHSEEGLESFRIFVLNDFEANVGIGDFYREGVLTSSVVDPTERLDVLDGRVRIRKLPSDNEAEGAYKVMVVDDTSDPLERGVVKWKNINFNTGCDWILQPNNDVSNTYPGSSCPWDAKMVLDWCPIS